MIGRNLHPILPEDRFDTTVCAEGRYRLVGDVRLDNRQEIIERLGLATADAARTSDSSLIFQCLLRWGPSAVADWTGEFAFAFWDGSMETLFLGRDFLGLRPLYYWEGKDGFAFASMPSGLHAMPEVPYDFDREYIAESVALVPHLGPRSFYRDISRVLPGNVLTITKNGCRTTSFWTPPALSRPHKQRHYAEGVRAALDDATSAQWRGADSCIASQLSGGLDSSIVTATAARLQPDKPVYAFTAVPPADFRGETPEGTIADESGLAALTARQHSNIEHVIVQSNRDSPLKRLDANFLYRQEPLASVANAHWGEAIHRGARDRGAKVILKAAVGNLSISYAGLEWLPYLIARGDLLTWLKHAIALARNGMPLHSLAARSFGPFIPEGMWGPIRRLKGRATGVRSYSAVNRNLLADLARKPREGRVNFGERPWADPYASRLQAFRDTDGGNALKAVLAEWGLSVRDPTADKRVVEFCLSVPFEEFVRGGVPRSLARRAFADRLPPEVSGWMLRGSQSPEWYESLDRARSDVAEELATILRCPEVSDILDAAWLQESIDNWPEGNWESDAVHRRYRLGLLRGISAGHFMRKVRGTN